MYFIDSATLELIPTAINTNYFTIALIIENSIIYDNSLVRTTKKKFNNILS